MSDKKISSAAFADTKPHYNLLDGLRGIAAVMVMCYHVFEGFATSPTDQKFNHGYLAVDFFFIISGFVISYAYDDRKSMGVKDFFKRRLIRLHPMVAMGALIGLIAYLIQGSVKWDGTEVAASMIVLAFCLNLFLLPVVSGAGADVRGNGEMYPLNGPSWSLFFEYIGNIIYILLIRRLSTRALTGLVVVSGILLFLFAACNLSGFWHLGVGWTMADYNFPGGFLRMMFSFSIGMLISRNFKPMKIRGAFWICSVALLLLFAVPHFDNFGIAWLNGIYDAVCIILIFPFLVYLGASGMTTDKVSSGICKFLGDISYPVYIIHYPFMYLFYAWLWKDSIPFSQAWPVALAVIAGSIVLAYLCLKLYDEPVRKYLANRFMRVRK